MGLAVGEAAERLGLSRVALSRVINGRAGISPSPTMRSLVRVRKISLK
ncbi:MAG: hypothetical protein KDJ87_18260 [Rhizobiaceae bacterium]|nr:hypothetical protein [Rhizobiaceae bacterium]